MRAYTIGRGPEKAPPVVGVFARLQLGIGSAFLEQQAALGEIVLIFFLLSGDIRLMLLNELTIEPAQTSRNDGCRFSGQARLHF